MIYNYFSDKVFFSIMKKNNLYKSRELIRYHLFFIEFL